MARGHCCGNCRRQSAVQHSPLVISLVTALSKPQPFPINLFYMEDSFPLWARTLPLNSHFPRWELNNATGCIHINFGFTDFLFPCAYNPVLFFMWFSICCFGNLYRPGVLTSASTCCISSLNAEFSAEIPDLQVHLCYSLVFIGAAEDQSQAASVEWQHLCPHSACL